MIPDIFTDGPDAESRCASCGEDLSVTRISACCENPTPNKIPGPSDVEIETYMRGECHVHAIASVRRHGGGFAIAYDQTEPYFEDGDDAVYPVVHVWSTHVTDAGPIARDVTGDVPATREAMMATIEEFFPDMWAAIAAGDVWIDHAATLEEIEELSGSEDRHPLSAISEGGLAPASHLPSVTAMPGSNPASPDPERGCVMPTFTNLSIE